MMMMVDGQGVDGFRLDVITRISKDIVFPELPKDMAPENGFILCQRPQPACLFWGNEPRSFFRYDGMNVGEASGININDALLLWMKTGRNCKPSSFWPYRVCISKDNFMYADHSNRNLVEWKKIFHRWDQVFSKKAGAPFTSAIMIQAAWRAALETSSEAYRELSATMLHTFLLSIRATPYI